MHISVAKAEVEALIDHLFEHSNTAPFISHKLIQRLVTANPSPRYIKAVVTVHSERANMHQQDVSSRGNTVISVRLSQQWFWTVKPVLRLLTPIQRMGNYVSLY